MPGVSAVRAVFLRKTRQQRALPERNSCGAPGPGQQRTRKGKRVMILSRMKFDHSSAGE